MRPTDALVTGFCKSPLVTEKSFAPLRLLRQQGHLRAIHCVTWDSPELDCFVAPVAAMPEVTVTRLPQPETQGTIGEKGVVWQIENLKAGLALLPGDGLVLKLRPDFVASADLLRDKIVNFDHLCAPVSRIAQNGAAMPEPVLKHKMWIPWGDSNQPFFCEDGAFLATHADARHLVTQLTPKDRAILNGGAIMGPYSHAVRFARIFVARWPLFARYLENFHYFVNDWDYRTKVVPFLVEDGFFWHLIIANAWILHSQFHVDAGEQGDIQFYANNCNKTADWSDIATLKSANPYDNLPMWRAGAYPGGALLNVSRGFGRLVDDSWQRALFTAPVSDLPAETLRAVMENVAASGDGRLAGIEQNFYRGLERLYRSAWPHAKTG